MNHRPDAGTISNTVYLDTAQMHNAEIVADALSTTLLLWQTMFWNLNMTTDDCSGQNRDIKSLYGVSHFLLLADLP